MAVGRPVEEVMTMTALRRAFLQCDDAVVVDLIYSVVPADAA